MARPPVHGVRGLSHDAVDLAGTCCAALTSDAEGLSVTRYLVSFFGGYDAGRTRSDGHASLRQLIEEGVAEIQLLRTEVARLRQLLNYEAADESGTE